MVCALALAVPAGIVLPARAEETIPIYEDLGIHHREVTTSSALAQDYFDQGLNLAYAFGRHESVESFRAALAEDPDCVMCAWGEAWALGPYINAKMKDDAALEAYAAIQRALQGVHRAGDVERALIEAMALRYAEDPEAAEREELDRNYAEAMRGVSQRFPEDDDVGALFAEALMVLHPWHLYPDGEPLPEAIEAIGVLEAVLERDLRHAGACHLYIHSVEPSSMPERAEACADLLADGIPLGSHIQHMPSHIYMRIGRYGDGVRANQMAHIVDQMAERGEAVAIYPGHNLRMLWFAAWMDGQSSVAIQAARDMSKTWATDRSEYTLVLARFGRWDELIAMKQAHQKPLGKGLQQFARGLALLRTGDATKAHKALKRLRKITDATDPEKTFSPDTEDGPLDVLQIAHGILAGELAAASGDVNEAVRLLERAVEVEDALDYSEPEIWPIPARQVLGGVLLDAGRAAEAQRVYEADLQDHPENGWSLFGLAESLRAQGENGPADEAQARFQRAWARADVLLTSSRF
jgi:tetratricopeptide (TPR) repeat protein